MLLNQKQAKMENRGYFSGFSKKPYNLLGFLPLLSDCYQYYTMKAENNLDKSIVEDLMNRQIWKDYTKNEITYVSPIFGGIDPRFQTDNEYYAAEQQKWAENGLPHKKSFTFKDDERLAILKNRSENQYILFFHGCDDGHFALRFKNEQDAKEYLEMVETFDDVMENENLICLN